MTARSKWVVLAVALCMLASMGLYTSSSTVFAARQAKAHVTKHVAGHLAASATNPKCKARTKPKGLVKISDWQFPDSMNPYQASLAVTLEINSGVFDGLYYYDNHAKLTSDIAAAVPSVKNKGILQNGKEYVVHIKPFAKWSNGQAITSQDLKFGWNIGMDKNSGPACSGSCDIISRIDTPNKLTAVYHLKSAQPFFLQNTLPTIPLFPHVWNASSGSWTSMDSATATNLIYQKPTYNWEDTTYPTNGPYQVSQFINNDRVVLQPDKYYDVLSCGANTNVIFVFFSSKAGLIAAAASKQTDVTTNYTLADVPTLQKNAGYKTLVDPAIFWEHLELNQDATYNGQPNPLHDVRVREALALALDKQGMLQSALGLNSATAKSLIAFSPIVVTKALKQPFGDPKVTGQWDPIAKKYIFATGNGQALADAKKLLDQTTFKNGFTLDWVSTQGNSVRQAQEAVISSNWARLGVKLNPNYPPASKLFGSWDAGGILQHGTFQVGDWAYQWTVPDPGALYNLFQSKYIDREQTVHGAINSNVSGIHDKLIDQAFNIANKTTDKKLRQKWYNTFQEQVNKNADWIMLYYRANISTADKNVKPVSNNPLGEPEWNMFQWKAAS